MVAGRLYSDPCLRGMLMVESTAKAEELYNPVLDSRAKAERLRATLIILQRHKEYFNLPSLIASDIKKVLPNPLFRNISHLTIRLSSSFSSISHPSCLSFPFFL